MMKKYILMMALTMPLVANAQHFEILETAGYSNVFPGSTNAGGQTVAWYGFENKTSFNYYPIKQLSIGVYYEINSWSPANHSFGLMPEFHLKHVYFGVDVSRIQIATVVQPETFWSHGYTATYDATTCIGAFAGSNQKIWKHLYANEQIGLKYFVTDEKLSTFKGETDVSIYYWYLLAGLSYRF